MNEEVEEKMSLEVRIPISPRPDYFNRIRLITLSIREFYPAALVRVSVGADVEPYDITKSLSWSTDLGIEWAWVPRIEFSAWQATAHPYIATMMERFRPPFKAMHVLMIDADVIAVEKFDELFSDAERISGVMAHASPFAGRHSTEWEDMFRGYGLDRPRFELEHSGWQAMFVEHAQRFSPPYFNTGVLFASSAMFEELYTPYMDALHYVREHADTYFFEQIALTLAVERAKIPVRVLPLRYNFPNQTEFDSIQAHELSRLRLLHFLRTDTIDREKDFESLAAIRRFAARCDLAGSNEVLRRRVAKLLQSCEA